MTQPLYPVRGIERTTPEFRTKLVQVAERIGADPTDLAAVIAFESGFSPTAQNEKSGATGLIQWLPSTARNLYGLTTGQIYTMSAIDQLDLVERYFRASNGPKGTVHDLYMLVWHGHPASQSEILAAQGELGISGDAYAKNSDLDRDRDGRITGAEASSFVRAIVTEARRKPPIDPKAGAMTDFCSQPERPSSRTYRLVIGDSPFRLASRFAGSGVRWRELYECNPRPVIDAFRAGMTITLPLTWTHG